jgi:hypothetical protein
LRSTVFHLSALFGLVALTAGLAPSVGCSDGLSDSQLRKQNDNAEIPAAAPSESVRSGTEGGVDGKEQLRGSPLCGVTAARCMPDDDNGLKSPPDAGPCVNPDAGTSITNACRITNPSGDDKSFESDCRSGDLRGVDGVACARGADCAPGFECIDGDRGGVCRRYCCTASSCSDHLSMNGGPTFCDIQKMVDQSSHFAPVCMPLKKCRLLHEGDCSALETCGIVTEKGENGCVPIGDAKIGESCDEQHCGKHLTCLGSPGDRRCFQLCRTDGADGAECGSTETCTTGAVFQNPAFGVCRTAPPR